MLTRITSILLLTAGFFTINGLDAQRVTVAVEPIEHFDPYFEDLAEEIERFVTRKLTENKALRVVERTDFSGITDEQERQKKEGFIDGETVAQGKLVGARLIVRFTYDEDDASLRLQTVDVGDGTILCSETYSTDVGDSEQLPQLTKDKITDALLGCFQQFTAPAAPPLQIVELLDKTRNDVRLLVYAEDTNTMEVGATLSIFTQAKKTIGNKEVDYAEVIGEFVVEEIENKHFLNGKVTKGGGAVRELLAEKQDIYAKSAQ